MFADSCFELSDDPALLSMIRNDRGYQTALREREGAQPLRQTVQPVIPQTEVPAATVQNEVTLQAAAVPVNSKPSDDNREHVLRIRYSGRPDSGGFARLLNFLAYFHGNIPVEILFESDNSITRLDDICRIAPDEAVLSKLAELVGEDNIEMT